MLISGWILTIYGDYPPPYVRQKLSEDFVRSTKIVWSITHWFNTYSWTFPHCMFVILAWSLRDILSHHNAILEKALEDNNNIRDIDLTNIILKHQRIVRLVEATSSTFGFLLLNRFVLDMVNTCLSTFILLFVCQPVDSKLQQFIWTAYGLIILSYLSHISAEVNSEVHYLVIFLIIYFIFLILFCMLN